jgi:hypothetical protein
MSPKWTLYEFVNGKLSAARWRYKYHDDEMDSVRNRSDCILNIERLVVCLVGGPGDIQIFIREDLLL